MSLDKRVMLGLLLILSAFSPSFLPRFSAQGKGELLALAAGDFDKDGVQDLLLARRAGSGSQVEIKRGNSGFLFPHLAGNRQGSPFTEGEVITELALVPDHLGVGDFDADGHLDFVAAQTGAAAVSWGHGNGEGRLRKMEDIQLPGALTAFHISDINRADGLSDVLLAVTDGARGQLQIWENAEGALRRGPESFFFDAPITTIAAGRLAEDTLPSVIAGAGTTLVHLSGRDRKLSADSRIKSQVQPAGITEQNFPAGIQSVAIGDFSGTGRNSLTVLFTDGMLQQLAREQISGAQQFSPSANGPSIKLPIASVSSSSTAMSLVTARVSSLPVDQCLIAGASEEPLWVWNNKLADREGVLAIPYSKVTGNLYRAGETTNVRALLPLRLNEDALNDLIVIRSGASEPEFIFTAPSQTFVVTSKEFSGPGTLAKAVQDAAASPGMDRIEFNLPGAPPFLLEVIGNLGGINEAIVIDGTTQPGYQGQPLIGIKGCGSSAAALELLGGNSVVRGLAIFGCSFDASGGPQDRGAAIKLNGGSNNIIEGNYLGLQMDGSCPLDNRQNCTSSGNYEVLSTNSANNLIGGTAAAARNVIAGVRVAIQAKGAGGNRIQGNLFGAAPDGSLAYFAMRIVILESTNNTVGGTDSGAGNTRAFVYLSKTTGCLIQGNQELELTLDASSANLIGGTTPTARNFSKKVFLIESSFDNSIQGNSFGVDASGTRAATGDNFSLALVTIAGNDNLIGGTVTAARNLILSQMSVSGSNNRIQGNYFGTNAAGTAALIYPLPSFAPTTFAPVNISGSNNLVGGTEPGAGNLFSGMRGSGLSVSGKNSRAHGNLIGTQADGISPLANQGFGILGGKESFIGGTGPGEGNVIAFNFHGGASGGMIRGNSIHSNQGLGIDYSGDGVSPIIPNEGHSGVDNYQNSPVLTLAQAVGEVLRVQGRLNSYANSSFMIDVYANSTCNYFGYGEGQTYLGSTTITTDANFNASFSFTLPRPAAAGQIITATATRVGGVTSEFSACVALTTSCVGAHAFPDTAGSTSIEGSSLVGNYYLIPADGGSGKIGIDTIGACPWTATSDATWLTLIGTNSGTGPGDLQYAAPSNPTSVPRSAEVTIGNFRASFLQAGRAAVVSAASFRASDIGQAGILAAFGSNLAPGTQAASTLPLPDILEDTLVMIYNDQGKQYRAPLFFVSPGQVNFLTPRPVGGFGNDTKLTIYNRQGSVSQARFFVNQAVLIAGALFSANGTGQGIASGVALRVKSDGSQIYEPLARFDPVQNRFIPVPLDLGPQGEQVYLVLFGTAIPNGYQDQMTAIIDSQTVRLLFLGPQGDFAGLDQANLLLPRTLAGKGLVEVKLENRGRFSNSVQVQIQ